MCRRYSGIQKIIIVYQSKLSAFLHLLWVMLLIYCEEDDILCHAASIILEIPGAPFPIFSTIVFRNGIFITCHQRINKFLGVGSFKNRLNITSCHLPFPPVKLTRQFLLVVLARLSKLDRCPYE